MREEKKMRRRKRRRRKRRRNRRRRSDKLKAPAHVCRLYVFKTTTKYLKWPPKLTYFQNFEIYHFTEIFIPFIYFLSYYICGKVEGRMDRRRERMDWQEHDRVLDIGTEQSSLEDYSKSTPEMC